MATAESLPEDIERAAAAVIEAARKVHAAMGADRAKAVYEACMAHELGQRGIACAARVPLPVRHGARALDTGLRLDLLVAGAVIVEIAALTEIPAVFEEQLRTYLKLADLRLALLINFKVAAIEHGIRRVEA
ncbi:MAG TPA: GxxExxY protein [Burkholderiales bacterium]|nr:GxxExxY protein [Burkholderiales bacterium]